ncbi:hypothetical protein MTO96_045564 [Rhipicephalus appendiculatus]
MTDRDHDARYTTLNDEYGSEEPHGYTQRRRFSPETPTTTRIEQLDGTHDIGNYDANDGTTLGTTSGSAWKHSQWGKRKLHNPDLITGSGYMHDDAAPRRERGRGRKPPPKRAEAADDATVDAHADAL